MYAKDVLDIDPFSSVKGVDLEGSDEAFAEKFATGAVSKPWQEEVSYKISFNFNHHDHGDTSHDHGDTSHDHGDTSEQAAECSLSRGHFLSIELC